MEALDEKRIKSIEYQKAYHARLKRAFGKRLRPKEFKVGDLVLKENKNANDEVKGKFEPN